MLTGKCAGPSRAKGRWLACLLVLAPVSVTWSQVEESPAAHQLPPGIYDRGQARIDGAFGIRFGQPLEEAAISKVLGWIATVLPDGWEYTGLVPYKMDSYLARPTLLPTLLKGIDGQFLVRTNFEGHPIWISATLRELTLKQQKEISDVLARMYIAETSEGAFSDGTNSVQLSHQPNLTRLDYTDRSGLRKYLSRRNVSLDKKLKEPPGDWGVSVTEDQILRVARHFRKMRPKFLEAHGVPFQTPHADRPADQYSPISVPEPVPMPWIDRVSYEMLASPEGMPINLRLTVTGTGPQLAYEKWLLEEALMLVFRGFLKRTEKHTVLLLEGNSVTVALRDNKMFVSVINGHQNRLALARDKQRRAQANAARAHAEKIAQRTSEMVEETGF